MVYPEDNIPENEVQENSVENTPEILTSEEEYVDNITAQQEQDFEPDFEENLNDAPAENVENVIQTDIGEQGDINSTQDVIYYKNDYNADNGVYYGQIPFYQQPKKTKLKTSVKVLILISLALTIGCIVGFFANFAIYMNNNGLQSIIDNILETTSPTEASDEAGQSTQETQPINDNLLNDGIKINLKNNDVEENESHNTRYAYDKIAQSTVGVAVYNGETGDMTKVISQGTGIVLSEEGYIVTNSHVIVDSKNHIYHVITSDGISHDAEVVGYDTRTDLAIIKIDASSLELVAAEFANSDQINIGEAVIAVGNPGGIAFQNSVSQGIISAVNRTVSTKNTVKYIQTDAAINPGNSGGPLANLSGQIIGINTIKITSTSYEGMGFAIPSVTVKEIAEDIIKNGYVEGRVRIGFTGTAITAADAQTYDIPLGIVIAKISEDGPLYGTEAEVGDIITAIDGNKVESFADIYGILATHIAGDEVTLSLYRESQSGTDKDIEFEVTINLQEDNGLTQD